MRGSRRARRFEGSKVLVTGGSSGIGLAVANAFLDEGARVAICARSAAALSDFRSRRPEALAIRADVTDPEARARLLDDVIERFGGLDILVNNAGRLIEHDFATAPPPSMTLAEELALNLLAPIQLTAATLERVPTVEALVFVTSGYALVSPRRAPTYGAAKAGLHAFAEGLRRQFKGARPLVLEVLPPTVDTPATAHRDVRKVSPEAVAAALLNGLQRRRARVLVGSVGILPLLLRLSPLTAGRMVGES